MAIPSPVYPPPFNITRASHVVLTVRDLAASRRFYTEVIGLVVSGGDDETIYLRGLEEACHHVWCSSARRAHQPANGLAFGCSLSRTLRPPTTITEAQVCQRNG